MYSFRSYVLVILVYICTASHSVTAVEIACEPTPQDLDTQFSNNCANLQLPMQKCEAAWQRFMDGFAGRDPLDVQSSDYQPYFMELPIEVGTSESLFWSGVPELVSMVNMMSEMGSIDSSKNIPASVIIDQLTGNICWCGDPEGGIQFSDPCPCDNCIPVISFWTEFSIQFAQAAKGTVFWLARGENPAGTYRNSSFFAMHEIPNLSTSAVNDVVILVVHRRGQGEACGEGTLMTLQNGLEDRGFDHTCYNIYGDPMDEQQLSALTNCTVDIITAVQEGKSPAPSSCFSTAMCLEFSWTVLVLGYIHVLVSSQIL